MVEKLYGQADEKLPEFQQIKEMFSYIDVRKDDHIDFQEFTQIFRNCKPPSLLMGTTPANQHQLIAKMTSSKDANKPTR
jgi:Ca2+-binding EF-hand superfamily protein